MAADFLIFITIQIVFRNLTDEIIFALPLIVAEVFGGIFNAN